MPYKDLAKKDAYMKAWREKNRERSKQVAKQWRADDPERAATSQSKSYYKNRDHWIAYNHTPQRRFSNAKSKAKRRNHVWLLTFEQWFEVASKPCEYCHGKLGSTDTTGSSCDRKDNNKGYTIDNVASCCKPCNSIKQDILSYEETKVAVAAVLKFREQQDKR